MISWLCSTSYYYTWTYCNSLKLLVAAKHETCMPVSQYLWVFLWYLLLPLWRSSTFSNYQGTRAKKQQAPALFAAWLVNVTYVFIRPGSNGWCFFLATYVVNPMWKYVSPTARRVQSNNRCVLKIVPAIFVAKKEVLIHWVPGCSPRTPELSTLLR